MEALSLGPMKSPENWKEAMTNASSCRQKDLLKGELYFQGAKHL